VTTVAHQDADIIDLLLEDHRTVARLFERLDEDLGTERREVLFRRLTTALVQHEAAEEVTVYPFLRKLGEAGEVQSDARTREQAEAEGLLRSMERLDVMGDRFVSEFLELRALVLRHAHSEENEVLPYLRGATSPEDRARLARDYERARSARVDEWSPCGRPASVEIVTTSVRPRPAG
jgi:hemerythrin-like domain-containing protein